MSESEWIFEWQALRIRCQPSFEAISDETQFFERLQDIGAWYFEDGDVLVVCVRLPSVDGRCDAMLAELRRQGVEPAIEAQGQGFARRDGARLTAYRVVIGGEVREITVPTGHAAQGTPRSRTGR